MGTARSMGWFLSDLPWQVPMQWEKRLDTQSEKWLCRGNESPRWDCRGALLSRCSYPLYRIALNLLHPTWKQKLTLNVSISCWRSESVEKKHRRGRQTTRSICVCWHMHGHSQERQTHFQSEVNPAESQDWRVRQFKSIILFGLWFWNHCTLQRVVLCGRWLWCCNYHYNYTGTFPSWRAPWSYSPVTWPGFLIVLERWRVFFFFLAWPQAGRVSMNWKAGNAKTVSSRAKKNATVVYSSTATITCGSFRSWGGGAKEPEHPQNPALQRKTPWTSKSHPAFNSASCNCTINTQKLGVSGKYVSCDTWT